MPYITVNDEQADVISQTVESIEIRDRNGKHLGYIAHGFSGEDISIAKKRMASTEPRYTTQEVLERIESLEQK